MSAPDDPEALRCFLCMISYLHKFISNPSEKTAPMRERLRDDTHWSWEDSRQRVFELLKLDNSQPTILKFCDPSNILHCP